MPSCATFRQLLLLATLGASITAITGCEDRSAAPERTGSPAEPAAPAKTPAGTPAPEMVRTSPPPSAPVSQPDARAEAPARPASNRVRIETNRGTIVVELNPQAAPITVENFLAYVNEGFYDGTIFHRVIPNFMIQGGGFTPDMYLKSTRGGIRSESRNGLKNVRGAIAMARTPAPDSATSQFFINHRDNPNLDYPNPDGVGYTVFGRVVEGMDVVDEIAQVPTHSVGMHANVPVDPVIIESIKVE